MPRLENWSVCILPSDDPYKAPELWPMVLQGLYYGDIYDDKRFDRGTYINTSSIKEINTITKKAQTSNTLYELGAPDPNFIEYIKSQGNTIDDCFHIDISDIKISEKHIFEIECWDFNNLVKRVYGHDYEYVADTECGNDSCQSYDEIGLCDISNKRSEEDLEKFIKTGNGNFMARILLVDMCRRKVIKPGNYLINVSW